MTDGVFPSDERSPRWPRRKPATKHETSSHFQRSIHCWNDTTYHSIYGCADKTEDGRAEGEGRHYCYTDGGRPDVEHCKNYRLVVVYE